MKGPKIHVIHKTGPEIMRRSGVRARSEKEMSLAEKERKKETHVKEKGKRRDRKKT